MQIPILQSAVAIGKKDVNIDICLYCTDKILGSKVNRSFTSYVIEFDLSWFYQSKRYNINCAMVQRKQTWEKTVELMCSMVFFIFVAVFFLISITGVRVLLYKLKKNILLCIGIDSRLSSYYNWCRDWEMPITLLHLCDR